MSLECKTIVNIKCLGVLACFDLPYRECIRGIGEDLLIKAYNIIDTQQEDDVEVLLIIAALKTCVTTRTINLCHATLRWY